MSDYQIIKSANHQIKKKGVNMYVKNLVVFIWYFK